MKYKETGFRAFYRHFAVVPLKDSLKKLLKDLPGEADANCILTYGYIDREAGFTLEVIAAGKQTAAGFSFADTNEEISSMIRIEAVEEDDCFFCDAETETALLERYAEKIETLHVYDADEEVEKTRSFQFIDAWREPRYPDDVEIYLVRDGNKPEKCWTRIIGLDQHNNLMCLLLNEPYQNFDYHQGELIAVLINKDDDGVFLYSNMNPSRKLTAKDLEDGSMLEAALATLMAERTEENAIELVELLRDSCVWIPCNAVTSEADQKQMEKMIEEAGDDPESLIGKEFNTLDSIRLIPDILQNAAGEYFFPVFSSCEAMGEYGAHFSKVQKHFPDAISLAKNSPKPLVGIVVNAFTDPYVLEAGLWDLVEKMKTRITE